MPFRKCITRIDEATIDEAENLQLVMPMHNLIEYSSNYSETTGSLWFYSKDEAANSNNNIAIINNLNFSSIRVNYQETQLCNLLQMLQMECYNRCAITTLM